ncbi:MAG: HPr family phosphocarrier protein [Propionibacteriaceae bacterium]|jgi:phosphocarrier protein FPr|nr:HPr family phosphocarrier protein [Propionibacteriaceae bacterium]
MIGIVVVSHSHALASAAVDLACEMVPVEARPTVLVAAGLDDTTFGTDAVAIADAITRAGSPDGVLIMVDLGSAILSAEMALDFIDPDLAARCVISPGPLVEGLVAAIVTASSKAPLAEVAREAAQGLAAKQEQLGDRGDESANPGAPGSTTHSTVSSASDPTSTHSVATDSQIADSPTGSPVGSEPAGDSTQPTPTDPGSQPDDALVFTCTINNPHGLHARPAAALIAGLRGLDAEVSVTNLSGGRPPVSAASLTSILMLNFKQGDKLQARIKGSEAERAYDQLTALARSDFGEKTSLKA